MKMRWENTKKETESSVLKTKEFLLSFPIAKILADSNTGVYNTVCRILDTGRLNLFYFAESWSGSPNFFPGIRSWIRSSELCWVV